MSGLADIASNQASRSEPVTDTQTRFPGPVAIDVGFDPTAKRPRTVPPGVIRTTLPVTYSETQRLPSGPSAMPLVAEVSPA